MARYGWVVLIAVTAVAKKKKHSNSKDIIKPLFATTAEVDASNIDMSNLSESLYNGVLNQVGIGGAFGGDTIFGKLCELTSVANDILVDRLAAGFLTTSEWAVSLPSEASDCYKEVKTWVSELQSVACSSGCARSKGAIIRLNNYPGTVMTGDEIDELFDDSIPFNWVGRFDDSVPKPLPASFRRQGRSSADFETSVPEELSNWSPPWTSKSPTFNQDTPSPTGHPRPRPVQTVNGCQCKDSWTYGPLGGSDPLVTEFGWGEFSGCANPDQDPRGNWCEVTDDCTFQANGGPRILSNGEQKKWDYCNHANSATANVIRNNVSRGNTARFVSKLCSSGCDFEALNTLVINAPTCADWLLHPDWRLCGSLRRELRIYTANLTWNCEKRDPQQSTTCGEDLYNQVSLGRTNPQFGLEVFDISCTTLASEKCCSTSMNFMWRSLDNFDRTCEVPKSDRLYTSLLMIVDGKDDQTCHEAWRQSTFFDCPLGVEQQLSDLRTTADNFELTADETHCANAYQNLSIANKAPQGACNNVGDQDMCPQKCLKLCTTFVQKCKDMSFDIDGRNYCPELPHPCAMSFSDLAAALPKLLPGRCQIHSELDGQFKYCIDTGGQHYNAVQNFVGSGGRSTDKSMAVAADPTFQPTSQPTTELPIGEQLGARRRPSQGMFRVAPGQDFNEPVDTDPGQKLSNLSDFSTSIKTKSGCDCVPAWTYDGNVYRGCANPEVSADNPAGDKNGEWCILDAHCVPNPEYKLRYTRRVWSGDGSTPVPKARRRLQNAQECRNVHCPDLTDPLQECNDCSIAVANYGYCKAQGPLEEVEERVLKEFTKGVCDADVNREQCQTECFTLCQNVALASKGSYNSKHEWMSNTQDKYGFPDSCDGCLGFTVTCEEDTCDGYYDDIEKIGPGTPKWAIESLEEETRNSKLQLIELKRQLQDLMAPNGDPQGELDVRNEIELLDHRIEAQKKQLAELRVEETERARVEREEGPRCSVNDVVDLGYDDEDECLEAGGQWITPDEMGELPLWAVIGVTVPWTVAG